MAEAEGGADNLARAARATLADMMATGVVRTSDLQHAEELARQALALDPYQPEARLQLAITLSLLSRDMSTREALDSGNASKGRDLAQSVLSDEPDNAYAHGFLAVWNVEVVRRGGAIGSAMLGASIRKGEDHYRQAVAIRRADASLHWQFARALAALNPRKYRDEIRQSLDLAVSAPTETALDRTMQLRAQSFRDYMAGHKWREIENMAQSLL